MLELWVFTRALSLPFPDLSRQRGAAGHGWGYFFLSFLAKLQEGSSPSLFVLILLFS